MASKQDTAKQAYMLITQFKRLYEKKTGNKAELNTYSAKYGFQDMIADLSFDTCVELLDFYFSGSKVRYTTAELFNSYHKLNRIRVELKEDEENRRQLRLQTKKRVEEWERTNGKS